MTLGRRESKIFYLYQIKTHSMGITRAMQPTGEKECVDDAIGNGFTQGMKVMHRSEDTEMHFGSPVRN